MNKREKTIGWIGVIAGSAAGSLLGMYVMKYNLAYLITGFISLVVLFALSLLVVFMVIECRREEKKKQRSFPANWGRDKWLER